MFFRTTGRVKGDFYVLGLAAFPVNLLDGSHPVLFEGGTSCAGKLYIDAIRSILGKRQPEILFFTHAHWDHCGAVSCLKEAFPGMKIAASLQAAQILKRPRVLELIAELNEDARGNVSNLPGMDSSCLLDAPFYPFEVDILITDKQIFNLGNGSTVEVLATPGHTRDHHSYYLPDQKVLVAGDAAGSINSSGSIRCEFLYDYKAYISTIAKLAALPIEVFSQGHQIVLVGPDEVKYFLESSMGEAIRFKNQVIKLLDEECGSADRVIQRIKAEYYDVLPEPKQPQIPFLINLTAQVKHLAAIHCPEQRSNAGGDPDKNRP